MSALDHIIPKPVIDAVSLITKWFEKSGISETLENTGTTGENLLITKINGKDALIRVEIFYLNDEDKRTLANIHRKENND